MCWDIERELTARAAAMGGAYMFSKDAAANLRQKDDSYNSAIGGAFAGSMLGLKCWSHSNICLRDLN